MNVPMCGGIDQRSPLRERLARRSHRGRGDAEEEDGAPKRVDLQGGHGGPARFGAREPDHRGAWDGNRTRAVWDCHRTVEKRPGVVERGSMGRQSYECLGMRDLAMRGVWVPSGGQAVSIGGRRRCVDRDFEGNRCLEGFGCSSREKEQYVLDPI